MNKKLIKLLAACSCILLIATGCGKKTNTENQGTNVNSNISSQEGTTTNQGTTSEQTPVQTPVVDVTPAPQEQTNTQNEDNNTISESDLEDANDRITDIMKGNNNAEVQTGYLAKTQEIYNKINLGMSEAEVIAAIGEPALSNGSDSFKTLYYNIDVNGSSSRVIAISLNKGTVAIVTNELMSNAVKGISLVAETRTEISDLTQIISKVTKGMTLDEVIAVLGNNYFEYEKRDGDEKKYKWVDLNDKSVTIYFSNNKVSYIGSVS